MKVTKKDCIENARLIRKSASRYLHSNVGYYAKGSYMECLIRQDAKELRNIATLTRAGKLEAACHNADFLESTVKEVIPERAWKFFQG